MLSDIREVEVGSVVSIRPDRPGLPETYGVVVAIANGEPTIRTPNGEPDYGYSLDEVTAVDGCYRIEQRGSRFYVLVATGKDDFEEATHCDCLDAALAVVLSDAFG